jgi:hypothetical protein
MNERDSFYTTLGLQPGASPDEIKSAYRRLVKTYHPDNDKSLDAEVRYKEIRVAYKTLLNRHFSSGAYTDPVASTYTSKQTTQTSKGWTSEREIWTAEDFATLYGFSSRRIPLKWKNLPSIFINSVKEMPIGVFFRGLISLVFTFKSFIILRDCDPMLSYGIVALYYVISWIFFVFLRYYFSPSEWSSFTRTLAVVLYGALMIILIACFYTVPRDNLISAGFWAAASIWILLVRLDELAYGQGG